MGWTGRTVLSPTIPAAEAASRAITLRRRLLVWDNVPVADGPMRPMLHLGPYSGRDRELGQHVSGLLLNPMVQARASGVTLRTAADYMRDPRGYDAEAAWRDALAELGEGAGEAFAVFAAAHRFSPLLPSDRDPELEAALTALRAALAGGGATGPLLSELRALLDARVAAAETLRANLIDRRLAEQIEPWLVSHRAESERMAAALELLEALCSDMAPMQLVFAFFRFEGMLTRIPPAAVASYGARRVLYPQLGCMRDDGAAFGADRALFVDRCLADEVVRLAEGMALARLTGG